MTTNATARDIQSFKSGFLDFEKCGDKIIRRSRYGDVDGYAIQLSYSTL